MTRHRVTWFALQLAILTLAPDLPALAEDLRYKVTDLGTLAGNESFGMAIAPASRDFDVDVWTIQVYVAGKLEGSGHFSMISCHQPFYLTEDDYGRFFQSGAGDIIDFQFSMKGAQWTFEDLAEGSGSTSCSDVWSKLGLNTSDGNFSIGTDYSEGTINITAGGKTYCVSSLGVCAPLDVPIDDFEYDGYGKRVTINDDANGIVAGWSNTVNGTKDHAFVASKGEMMDIGTLGGSVSRANGINAGGFVVGSSTTLSGATRAFQYANGQMRDLGTLGGANSTATAINRSLYVVGFADVASGDSHAFLGNYEIEADLGTLGGPNSAAFAINELNQVVGRADVRPGRYHAFLYANGVMQDLGTLGGLDSAANGINDHGDVVGYSKVASQDPNTRHAFVFREGSMIDLLTLGGMRSEARDINNRGDIVGFSTTASGVQHGFLHQGGVMRDLNDLSVLEPNWRIENAHSIDDDGRIAGVARNAGGMRRAVLLTPIDEAVAKPTINTVGQNNCVNRGTQYVTGGAEPRATVVVDLNGLKSETIAQLDGTWSAAIPDAFTLPEGPISLSVYQVDSAGNTSAKTVKALKKDMTPPGVSTTPDLDRSWDTGVSDTDNLTRLPKLRLVGSVSEPSLIIRTIIDGGWSASLPTGNSLANGTWSLLTASLSSGQHLIRVYAIDACGNFSAQSGSLSVVIDTSAPNVTVGSVAGDNRINAAEALAGLNINGTAEPSAALVVSIQAANRSVQRTLTSGGSWQVSLPPSEFGTLADGQIVIKAKASDRAGNTRTASRSVAKDTVIGTPTIGAIAGDDVISKAEQSSAIAITGTAERTSAVTLTIGGLTKKATANSSGIWSVSLTAATVAGLPTGAMQVRATAKDKAGNVSQTAARSVQKQ